MRGTQVRGQLTPALARRFALLVMLAGVPIIALAGCGAAANGGLYGGTTTSTGGTNSQTSSSTVATASAVVKGASESIMTDANGRTLYYFTLDSSTKSACTTGCIGTWPPLTISSGSPSSASQLSGTLSASDTGNGMQVQYNGHPLYRYSGDTAAGQTNGEGIDGQWFVATPNLAVNSGSTGQPATTPPSCTGYNCNG